MVTDGSKTVIGDIYSLVVRVLDDFNGNGDIVVIIHNLDRGDMSDAIHIAFDGIRLVLFVCRLRLKHKIVSFTYFSTFKSRYVLSVVLVLLQIVKREFGLSQHKKKAPIR